MKRSGATSPLEPAAKIDTAPLWFATAIRPAASTATSSGDEMPVSGPASAGTDGALGLASKRPTEFDCHSET
jgi:hypothetical protein